MEAKELLRDLSKTLRDEKIECSIAGKCRGNIAHNGIISLTNTRIIFYSYDKTEFLEYAQIVGLRSSLLDSKIKIITFAGKITIRVKTGNPGKFINLLWTKMQGTFAVHIIEKESQKLDEMPRNNPARYIRYLKARLRLKRAYKQSMHPKKAKLVKVGIVLFVIFVIALILLAVTKRLPFAV